MRMIVTLFECGLRLSRDIYRRSPEVRSRQSESDKLIVVSLFPKFTSKYPD
jgi:hypothetical protein